MEYLGKENVPIYGWTKDVPVNENALNQLKNIAKLPFIHHHLAVMPDVHLGVGSTVGSVIPTLGAIIPAAVGVDIGCGMLACRTNIKADRLPDNLANLRSHIESKIPHGRTDNGGANDRGAWHDVQDFVLPRFGGHDIKDSLFLRMLNFTYKHPKLERASKKAPYHLGTLGTGNHFIEVCLDEEGYLWVMLHSGSRGIGNAIGSYFIEKAKEDMRKWFINLPDQDLAYLAEGTENFDDYVEAVHWAQEFAMENRNVMFSIIKDILMQHFPDIIFNEKAINCHHNYVTKEQHYGKSVWLTRKGAVQAREGTLGIIPGSMGQKSYIVRGKGNKESFHTCSHGAGRVMSRGEANKSITLEQHIQDTAGVECRKDISVIDESPRAYKDIDKVMAAQNDLVEIVHTLKQILCVKV